MNDREFDDLLRTASTPLALPAPFRREVWQRIESSAAADFPAWMTRFHLGSSGVASGWAAAVGIAAMVALGLWLGAATTPQAKDAKLVYAESISPFSSTHHP